MSGDMVTRGEIMNSYYQWPHSFSYTPKEQKEKTIYLPIFIFPPSGQLL